jgi:hypothetical protein
MSVRHAVMFDRVVILLLVFLCLDTYIFVRGARVSLQHVNAADEHGWLHIKIDFSMEGENQGFNAHIAHVDWCSALSAHSEAPRIDPAKGTCVGKNVMHKRIYTASSSSSSSGVGSSARNVVIYRPEDGSLFVNPEAFGGMDPTREAYIVVHTTFVRNGGQVTDSIVSALRMDTPPSRYQAPAAFPNGDGDAVVWNPSATVPMKTEVPKGVGLSSSSNPYPTEQPWYIVMAGGVVCMLCVAVVIGALLLNKSDYDNRGFAKWSKSMGLSSSSTKRADDDNDDGEIHMYGPSQYQFSSSPGAPDPLFMVTVDIKERNREKQVSLLMQLGKGANAAFEQNL